MIRKIGSICMLAMVLCCGAAQAQDVAVVVPEAEPAPAALGPSFFAALVAGVILAVAFQLVLTHLSLAAGVSAVDMEEIGKGKDRDSEKARSESWGRTARKITTGYGVWALVTASIALFFASWLAVELSLTGDLLLGVVIALSIWGLFYVVMTSLELSAMSSLVGTLFSTATSGLKAAYQTTASMLGKSPEDRAVDAASQVIDKVRKEIFGDGDGEHLREELEHFVEELKPAQYTPEQMREELRKLLSEVELKAVVEYEGPLLEEQTIRASLEQKGMSREDVAAVSGSLKDAIGKIREEYKSGKDTGTMVADATMRVTGMSKEEAQQYRAKVEDYLRNTGRPELNPEGIKQDIEKLFHDPAAGMEALRARFSQVDRDTVVAALSQREDVSEPEARKIADTVMNAISSLTSRAESGGASVRDQAAGKIRDFLGKMEGPKHRYEQVKRGVQRVLQDPKAEASALADRLRHLDRDSIKDILSSSRWISDQDAEQIVTKIESARDEVIHKAEQMKDEVDRRIGQAKDEARHQAEEVRKTAASAAWWTFGTAVVSGVAAAIGGLIAAGWEW